MHVLGRDARSPPSPSAAHRAWAFLVAAAIATGAFATLVADGRAAPCEANAFWETRAERTGDGTRVDYVGYDAGAFDPRADYSAERVQAALDRWVDAHWAVQWAEPERVEREGLTLGYRIAFGPLESGPARALADDVGAEAATRAEASA